REGGIDTERLVELRERSVVVAERQETVAEVRPYFGGIRLQVHRRALMLDGLFRTSGACEQVAEIAVRLDVSGIEPDRGPILFLGLAVAAFAAEHDPEVVVGVRIRGT